MSMFANNALLGGGVIGLGFGLGDKDQKIKGTTKPLMANLDITPLEACLFGLATHQLLALALVTRTCRMTHAVYSKHDKLCKQ